MLLNLLSTDSSSGLNGEDIALGVLTIIFVAGMIFLGVFFLVKGIIKGDFKRENTGSKGFAVVTAKEKERLYCSLCPFTGESLKLDIISDKSYRTEVKEIERYQVSNVTSSGFMIDKNPIKQKVGGEYVQGDYIYKYTSPTYGYSVLKDVKFSTAWGDEKHGDDGIKYKVVTTKYSVESFGKLDKKQQAKLERNCKVNSVVDKYRS